MSRPTFRLGLPELVSALALAGLAWFAWRAVQPIVPSAPDAVWRCDDPANQGRSVCFVRVAGGVFLMGAQADDPDAPGFDPAAEPQEGPVHEVTVRPFWMLHTELTVGAYRACVREGACDEAEVLSGGPLWTYAPVAEPDAPARDQLPLNGVTWAGARDVCAWLGGTLPSEAQWAWAARGAGAHRWPWGDTPQCGLPPRSDRFAVRGEFSTDCTRTGPLGARAIPNRSHAGVVGLAGNVWEWTVDGWAEDAYAHHGAVDPVMPATGTHRAARGGGWTATTPEELRSSVGLGLPVDAQLPDVGLRCV
ncbi:MAG: formylglycine-generating enzyme family protein, partial [Myxococcales bacterium]|nr:formylglycine-generating enzyme family protein [Myxococcales bacterium]